MERRPHVIHQFEEAPLMRLKVRSLRRAVKEDLAIVSFQLDTGAEPKRRSPKRTYACGFR
jgi:hypothetical protein